MDELSKEEFDELKRKYENLEKSQGKLLERLDKLAQVVRDLITTLRDVQTYGLENEGRKKIATERMRGHSLEISSVLTKIWQSRR